MGAVGYWEAGCFVCPLKGWPLWLPGGWWVGPIALAAWTLGVKRSHISTGAQGHRFHIFVSRSEVVTDHGCVTLTFPDTQLLPPQGPTVWLPADPAKHGSQPSLLPLAGFFPSSHP